MEAREFTDGDYFALRGWYEGHKQSPPLLVMLPKIGFIVPGIGACFLLPVIGAPYAYWDFFISRPGATRLERELAFDAISAKLEEKAKDMGYSFLLSNTQLAQVSKRLEKYGWKNLGIFECFAKEIG